MTSNKNLTNHFALNQLTKLNFLIDGFDSNNSAKQKASDYVYIISKTLQYAWLTSDTASKKATNMNSETFNLFSSVEMILKILNLNFKIQIPDDVDVKTNKVLFSEMLKHCVSGLSNFIVSEISFDNKNNTISIKTEKLLHKLELNSLAIAHSNSNISKDEIDIAIFKSLSVFLGIKAEKFDNFSIKLSI